MFVSGEAFDSVVIRTFVKKKKKKKITTVTLISLSSSRVLLTISSVPIRNTSSPSDSYIKYRNTFCITACLYETAWLLVFGATGDIFFWEQHIFCGRNRCYFLLIAFPSEQFFLSFLIQKNAAQQR